MYETLFLDIHEFRHEVRIENRRSLPDSFEGSQFITQVQSQYPRVSVDKLRQQNWVVVGLLTQPRDKVIF